MQKYGHITIPGGWLTCILMSRPDPTDECPQLCSQDTNASIAALTDISEDADEEPVAYYVSASRTRSRSDVSFTSSTDNTHEEDPLVSRALHFRELPLIKAFFSHWRYGRPIMFDNVVTEARDLCMCERTYLAWIKLVLYLLIAGVVLFADVRLPTNNLETASSPLTRSDITAYSESHWIHVASRIICWIFIGFSFLILLVNQANYIHQVTGYLRMRSRVTSLRAMELLLVLVSVLILFTTILVLARQ